MSECEEIAMNTAKSLPREAMPVTMDEARSIVRKAMPEETHTVIDNVAEALLREARRTD